MPDVNELPRRFPSRPTGFAAPAGLDGTFCLPAIGGQFVQLIGPVLPVRRKDLNLPTRFGIHPKLPAQSAGKHKCMNGFAVFDSETQIAVLRDFFEGLDGLPHIAF